MHRRPSLLDRLVRLGLIACIIVLLMSLLLALTPLYAAPMPAPLGCLAAASC